jgi:hypothetical protein
MNMPQLQLPLITTRFSIVMALALIFVRTAYADFLVSDNFGNQIVRYADNGSPLAPFVSAGSGGLTGAVGMVFAPNGDLLVASQSTNQVLRYNGTTGAFNGVLVGNNLAGPAHLQFHSNGNLLVSNFTGNSISEFTSTGTYVREFTSGTPGGGLQGVSSFATAPNGDVYAGSFNSGEIYVYNSDGVYQRTFATGFGGASGLRFSGSNLWVASLLNSRVALLDPTGAAIRDFSTGEISPGTGTFPSFILDSPFSSNEILVALAGAGGVYRYAIDGSTVGPVNPFLIGGGLQVPGEVLQVALIPEPGFGFGLGLFTLASVLKRRRIN